jgi:hypothetical protein
MNEKAKNAVDVDGVLRMLLKLFCVMPGFQLTKKFETILPSSLPKRGSR